MSCYHVPIMLDECLENLKIKSNGIYFDGTLGGGGHSYGILSRGGRVVGVDKDDDALANCKKRFKEFEGQFVLVKDDFKNADEIIEGLNISDIDGAILDLGVSSYQLDTPQRGFSFRFDAPLDMRMDTDKKLTAEIIVNEYSREALLKILYEYGEERYAKRIVDNIIRAREKARIKTTFELSELVKKSVPPIEANPQKRTFQAIRIEVNGELTDLDASLKKIFSVIKKGGRLCVITFHSLEDRIVKQCFKLLATDCVCPKSFPVCVCGHKAEGKIIGKFKPSATELKQNTRSASSTLRIIEKL